VVGLTRRQPAVRKRSSGQRALEYRYSTRFKEPAGGADIAKSIVNFTHVDGDKWGATSSAPTSCSRLAMIRRWAQPMLGSRVYAVYRRDFSSTMSGTKGGHGLIADFGLQVGADANAKNSLRPGGKKLLIGGLYVDWAVPVGFLKTAFEACHEWNQNGIVGKAVEFDTTFCFESAWSFPIKVAGHTVKFNGFFNVVAPKGKDGFGAQTKTEVLTRPGSCWTSAKSSTAELHGSRFLPMSIG
jgi:hypothetical protein